MKNKRSLSVLAVIAANLVPVAMAALGCWGVGDILVLYWAETGVIGFFAALRFFFAGAPVPAHKPLTLRQLKTAPAEKILPLVLANRGILSRPVVALFFAFPYAMFMILQGLALYLALVVLGTHGWPVSSLKWGLLALFASHTVDFFWGYLATGEFRRTRPEECAATPLNRLLLMQLVLAGGAGVSRSFDGSGGVMTLFVLGKLALELRPAKASA